MNREAKVGLFVLLASLVIAYFVLNTSDIAALWQGEDAKQTFKVELSDASGVREGTPIRVAGVEVGEVTGIQLKGAKAIATVEVSDDIELGTGTRIEMKSQGILGERYLALIPGNGSQPLEGPLSAEAPPSLEDITTTIQLISEDLKLITGNLAASTQTDSGRNRIDLIAQNIEKLTQTLVDMVAENRANLKSTSDSMARVGNEAEREIPELLRQMNGLIGELRETLQANRPSIDGTFDGINKTAGNFESTTGRFDNIAKKLEDGDGTIGKLINDPSLHDNLNRLITKAEKSVEEVGKLVSRANEFQLNFHVRGDYLVEHEANRSHFGLTLSPGEEKYYLLEGVGIPDELLINDVDVVTEEIYNADGELQQTLVRTTVDKDDDFKFTGLLAYRMVKGIYLRGGMIESEGGGGIDFHLDDYRLRFSLDAWNFNRDDLSAQGRFDVRYSITKNIQLNFGYDELLESTRDSAYLGAAIRWKDDDLKVLLSQMGSLF